MEVDDSSTSPLATAPLRQHPPQQHQQPPGDSQEDPTSDTPGNSIGATVGGAAGGAPALADAPRNSCSLGDASRRGRLSWKDPRGTRHPWHPTRRPSA
eukprot:1028576-Pyramimonas_sp.AAC.1